MPLFKSALLRAHHRAGNWCNGLLVCLGLALISPAPGLADYAGAPVRLQAQQLWIQDRFTGESKLETIPAPDTALWNAARIGHYLNSLKVETRPPMGVLVIEKIGLEVPVYNGTGDLELDRGTGRIPGTGTFYGDGNLAISGHRDGFFRGLKNLKIGDRITLRGVDGNQEFTVKQFNTVHKSEHSALRITEQRMLTLVTCYPFYFVGHAPDRYIVQAVPVTPVLVSSE